MIIEVEVDNAEAKVEADNCYSQDEGEADDVEWQADADEFADKQRRGKSFKV